MKKVLFCCSRLRSDTCSDKLFCVCESWCRLLPMVVSRTSSAPPQRKLPPLEKSFLPGDRFCCSDGHFPDGSLFSFCFSSPCSLSLTLRIALKLICLVLTQRPTKRLWCDPIQYLYTELGDNETLIIMFWCKRSSVKKCAGSYCIYSNLCTEALV